MCILLTGQPPESNLLAYGSTSAETALPTAIASSPAFLILHRLSETFATRSTTPEARSNRFLACGLAAS